MKQPAALLVLTTAVLTGGSVAEAAPAKPLADRFVGVQWYGVYLMGRKIGWTKVTLSRSADGRTYEALTTLTAQLKGMGKRQEMTIDERRVYTAPDWRLTRIEATHATGPQRTVVKAHLEGGGLRLTFTSGGVGRRVALPAPKETLDDLVRDRLMAADAAVKPGAKTAFHMFEPLRMAEGTWEVSLERREEVVLEGVKTTVAHVRTVNKASGERMTSRIADDGRIIEATVGANLVQRLEPEDVAKQIEVAVDPFALASIRLTKELPDATKMTEAVFMISGVDDARFRIESDRQHYASTATPGTYRLTLRRSSVKAADVVAGPYEDEALKSALAPTPLVQSDDPRIVRLATSIVGDETDPLKRVGLIVAWVYKKLKKEYVAALSSALDVYDSGKGDCTEHSILFVALCRAAGIPARQVAGVVHGGGYGGFLYHAWAQVWVGRKWIDVDPTFNKPLANATHLAFAVGPLEKQSAVVLLIGSVKMRYVSHKEKRAAAGS